MKLLSLTAIIRKRRTYSSYKGEVGKKADNLINRDFSSSSPLKKLYTDITEFKLPNTKTKLYLSPILDGYNSEIINFSLSTSPNLAQLKETLNNVFIKTTYEDTILHSDQGWQYQHKYYHKFLKEKGISPSMSRKGNSLDNGMMESFFSTIKSEMFYGFEHTFKSINDLATAIKDYIYYYNNKRIMLKLKGLSPVSFRTKSFH